MTTPEPAQSLPAAAEVSIPWLRAGSLLVATLICVPVVAVFLNVLIPRADTWRHLASTVLPDYVFNTGLLVALVGFGVIVPGVGCAWLTSMCRFPLARFFEWALLLPLAMPAYVMAYVYTDFLQFAGPLQGALRAAFGWKSGDYWFPDVRSLGGAAFVLGFVLYPYVYLLARAAFLEQSASALETARILGESSWRSFWSIALPLARPAIVAGTALCLMETLADYGTVAYFGVDTFSTGIFRAWFSMGDPVAAAQLGALLLAAVGAVLALERFTRGRAAFHSGSRKRATPHELRGARAFGATLACGLPLLIGFALPAALLLRLVLQDEEAVLSLRFARLAWNSFTLAGVAALLAVACALAIAYALRLRPGLAERAAHRIAGLGYAVPGVVIAVGVMVPLTRLDQGLAALLPASIPAKLVLSGTVLALLYAYLVRFLAVALQRSEE
ncbi:MAG: iron ABC transporter permease, partial [Betaproteobacteria bacterium]